jgi:hypothetical protein
LKPRLDSKSPPPSELPQISFFDWVKHYNSKDARNPTIHANTCIKRDVDGVFKAEYEAWLWGHRIVSSAYAIYTAEAV